MLRKRALSEADQGSQEEMKLRRRYTEVCVQRALSQVEVLPRSTLLFILWVLCAVFVRPRRSLPPFGRVLDPQNYCW